MPDQHDSSAPPGNEGGSAELDVLVGFLQRSRGFDFTGYKRASLGRRIQRRMQLVGVATYPDYVAYLQEYPDEVPQLSNMVLINVTGFYRDPAAWDALAARLPKLLDARAPDRPIRVWCAGCASGEEAYTLAMLFAERMEREDFAQRVKIYATDADEEALAQARLGIYGPKAVEGVPAPLLEKYFTSVDGNYSLGKELRRVVIFGRHDLTHDPPISCIDVLTCRNTLMYFNTETQRRIIDRLHFALNDDGLLLLGKAETLLTHDDLFKPLDPKQHLFTRATRASKVQEREPADARAPVDRRATNVRSFERATFSDEKSHFDVSPRLDRRPASIGTPLAIADVTRDQRLETELRKANAELETAHEELQSTSEELHSTVEELETTNEELQSTNEELETMNEELQSTNEELQTVNDELRRRGDDLDASNDYFDVVLTSMHAGVIVLDPDLVVRAWSRRVEDQWGLCSDEVVGKHFLDLDIGLPVAQLGVSLRASLGGEQQRVEHRVDAVDRRGTPVTCKVVVTPLRSAQRRGVILLVQDA